jgi:hypothetical protein
VWALAALVNGSKLSLRFGLLRNSTQMRSWVRAFEPGGWIQSLRCERPQASLLFTAQGLNPPTLLQRVIQ